MGPFGVLGGAEMDFRDCDSGVTVATGDEQSRHGVISTIQCTIPTAYSNGAIVQLPV